MWFPEHPAFSRKNFFLLSNPCSAQHRDNFWQSQISQCSLWKKWEWWKSGAVRCGSSWFALATWKWEMVGKEEECPWKWRWLEWIHCSWDVEKETKVVFEGQKWSLGSLGIPVQHPQLNEDFSHPRTPHFAGWILVERFFVGFFSTFVATKLQFLTLLPAGDSIP